MESIRSVVEDKSKASREIIVIDNASSDGSLPTLENLKGNNIEVEGWKNIPEDFNEKLKECFQCGITVGIDVDGISKWLSKNGKK